MSKSENIQSQKTKRAPARASSASGTRTASSGLSQSSIDNPKFSLVSKPRVKHGLVQILAVLRLKPVAIRSKFGIDFKKAQDDELGQFDWSVIEIGKGQQFGFRRFSAIQSQGTEVLIDERTSDLAKALREFQDALEISKSEFTWINQGAL